MSGNIPKTNFHFLQSEWPSIYEAATEAEKNVYTATAPQHYCPKGE